MEKNLLGLEINIDQGYSFFELEESKVISSGHEIY